MPTPPSQSPGATQPGATQPGSGQPGATQPGGGQPGGGQPGGGQLCEADRGSCPRVGQRPLPDPAAVRLLAVPDSAPPYDDAFTGRPGVAAAVGADHIDPRDQDGRDQDDGTDHELRETPAGQDVTAGREPADPEGWPGQFAQVLVETLAGSRPPRQMVPWTTQRARANIQRLGPTLTTGRLATRQRPLVRRVITSRPARDVVEMTVIAGFGPRVRALAVRLERTAPRAAAPGHAARAARWLCTAVEAA
jgi:hypothetical protein